MDRAKGQPAGEHIEIDHPWISNDLMPLYRWTFPSEATDEELRVCPVMTHRLPVKQEPVNRGR